MTPFLYSKAKAEISSQKSIHNLIKFTSPLIYILIRFK